MGRSLNEVTEEMKKVPYEVISGDNGSARVQIGDRVYSPPEISSMILQKMRKTAEEYLGQEVTEGCYNGACHTLTIPKDKLLKTQEKLPD